jgi:hypothetical protein
MMWTYAHTQLAVLTLPLFVLLGGANHQYLAMPFDDLAIVTPFFNRSANFHDFPSVAGTPAITCSDK